MLANTKYWAKVYVSKMILVTASEESSMSHPIDEHTEILDLRHLLGDSTLEKEVKLVLTHDVSVLIWILFSLSNSVSVMV